MIPLSLAEIARITGGRLDGGADPAAVVTGPVVIDSRRARPGGLFAAVEGERVDGHDFAAAARDAGATAMLGTRPAGVPGLLVDDVPTALAWLAQEVVARLPEVTIAGLTGSAGKTSTKDLTAQLVERLGPTISPEGSWNNEFGFPLTVLRADQRTRFMVLEMAARTEARIVTFGLAAGAGGGPPGAGGTAAGPPDFAAAGVRLDDLGRPSFTLITPAGSVPVRMGLHGAHQIPNALAAAATAAELGLGLDGIADGLATATARSRWRMEVREAPGGVTVINDAYNANPESVRAALDALGHMARGGRAFAVLGQMNELGDESRDSHLEAGAHAAGTGVTGLIVVGKEAEPILDGAMATSGWHGEAIGVPTGAEAVAALRARLAAGDVVLVKASRSVGLETVAADLLSQSASSSASEKETAQ